MKRAAGFDDEGDDDDDDMPARKNARTTQGALGNFSGVLTDPGVLRPASKGNSKGKDVSPGAPIADWRAPPEEPKVETTPMDFSRLTRDLPSHTFAVPQVLVEHLMTPQIRELITEETGAEVEWAPRDAQVVLRGSSEQLRVASRVLSRVKTHCHWGSSEDKVRRLVKPWFVEKGLCRLSPMNTLRPVEKLLYNSQPSLSIGKDSKNDVVISDPLVSRHHCIIELDADRGAIYVTDRSTNGTFLNGIRLPSKKLGKVLLSHGDELLLKDPAGGEQEFGYIVNLQELQVRHPIKLDAPQRLLTAEEMAPVGRDFA